MNDADRRAEALARLGAPVARCAVCGALRLEGALVDAEKWGSAPFGTRRPTERVRVCVGCVSGLDERNRRQARDDLEAAWRKKSEAYAVRRAQEEFLRMAQRASSGAYRSACSSTVMQRDLLAILGHSRH